MTAFVCHSDGTVEDFAEWAARMSAEAFAAADTPRAWSAVEAEPYPDDPPHHDWARVVKIASGIAVAAIVAVVVMLNPPGHAAPSTPGTQTVAAAATPPTTAIQQEPTVIMTPPAVTAPPSTVTAPPSTVTAPPSTVTAPPSTVYAPIYPTMRGHYTETETNPTTGQSTTYEFDFTPCGEGCADATMSDGILVRARLYGSQWGMDINGGAACPDGSHVPGVLTVHLVWDAYTLTGTASATSKYAVCGSPPSYTNINNIRFRRTYN
jgi:hypothetical protein